MTVSIPEFEVPLWLLIVLACVVGGVLYLLLGAVVGGVMVRTLGEPPDRSMLPLAVFFWPMVLVFELFVLTFLVIWHVFYPFVWLARKVGGL